MRGGQGQGYRRRGHRDRGQATVEFALVLPLLVVLLAGLVWVGNLMITQVRVENAAREGARAAAVEPERASSAATSADGCSMPHPRVGLSLNATYVEVEVTAEVERVPQIVSLRSISRFGVDKCGIS